MEQRKEATAQGKIAIEVEQIKQEEEEEEIDEVATTAYAGAATASKAKKTLVEEDEDDDSSDEENEASDYENDPTFLTSDFVDDDADSDIEEIAIVETENADDFDDHDDDTIFEEFGEEIGNEEATIFTARDGTEWTNLQPPEKKRKLQHNVRRNTRNQVLQVGPKVDTKMFSQYETFKHILSKEICSIIIRETNRRAKQSCDVWNEKNPEKTKRIWNPVNEIEFDAFIGLLLFAGVSKSNCEHTKDLWSSLAHPIYRAAMSIRRFWQICKYIRFDNSNTRQKRLVTNKAAPISEIWLMLNDRLRNSYNAGDNITIHEQLYPYRGSTRFTQYIPSKPARYGIKVWWICDATSSYPLQGQIYTGMRSDCIHEKNQGERVVLDLCNIFKGSGRNITCDHVFTTLNLAKRLWTEYNLSIIGTVNRKRTFIPPEFLVSREVCASVFGFQDNVTMCSYFPKKNKAVVLLSTSHYSTEVVGPQKKPTIILEYNRTKGCVDNMDKMLGKYTCKRRTLRWPLAFFYNMLDISALAAYIIFQENNATKQKRETNMRQKFLQELGRQLVLPNIQIRANNTHITRNFCSKNAIESMLQTNVIERMDESPSNTIIRDSTGRIPQKGKCYLCVKKRPSRKACQHCKRPVCNDHSTNHTTCAKC